MKVTAMALFLLVLFISPANAMVVSIRDLTEQPSSFDGKTVTLTAEVVGDVMLRGSYGWINVTDGSGSTGVYGPRELMDTLVPGRYGTKGDVITITGVFNRSCPAHGGDMDIHALTLAVSAPHQKLTSQVNQVKYVVAAGLFLVFVAMCCERIASKRQRTAKGENAQMRTGLLP